MLKPEEEQELIGQREEGRASQIKEQLGSKYPEKEESCDKE